MTVRSWLWVLLGTATVAATALTSCSLILGVLACSKAADCEDGSACDFDSGLCTPFLNEQCDYSIGAVGDPGSVTLGAIFPTQVDNRDSGISMRQAIELAVDQINIGGGIGGAQERSLAVLVCDDGGLSELGIEAALHLVEVVGVPAILGPGFSRVLIEVAEQVTIDAGVVLMSPSATALELRDLDDNDLVWRTAPPDSFQTRSMAYFTTYPLLEAAAGSGNSNMVVTLAFADDTYGRGLANNYALQLPGYLAPFSSQLSVGIPVEVAYDSTNAVEVDGVAQRISATAPDVVLLVGYEEAAVILEAAVLDPVLADTAWFVPDGVRTDALRIVFGQESDKPGFLFGTAPSSRTDSPVFTTFASEYLARYAPALGEPQTWTEHAYDATYLLAYALSAIPGEPTGADIASGLARLSDPDGSAVTVGREDLVVATSVMADGGSLLVTGASGVVSFDPDTGDPTNADILRWDLAWQGGGAWAYEDCGVASSFTSDSPSGEADWCAALCMDPLAGDDDDSADGGGDPCKPGSIP